MAVTHRAGLWGSGGAFTAPTAGQVTFSTDGGTGKQRGPNDPLTSPDLIVTLQDAETQASVSDAEVRIFRASTGAALGGTESGGPAVTISGVGYFGPSASGIIVVVLKPGYRPARVAAEQTLTGATVAVQLIPDAVYTASYTVTGVSVDTGAKTITLANSETGQDLYSYLVDLWHSDDNLPDDQFPIIADSKRALRLRGGWDFADDTSRKNVLSAGWRVFNTSGAVTQVWANVTTLGSIGASEQVRYQQIDDGAFSNFSATGLINEPIQVYRDDNGDGTPDFDRTGYLRLIVRTYARTYEDVDVLATLGLTALEADSYAIALATAADPNVIADDATVTTSAPYTGMSYTILSTPDSVTVAGSTDDYSAVGDVNNANLNQWHTWMQWALRQDADIDSGAGTLNGLNAQVVSTYRGTELVTLYANGAGTYLTNVPAAQLSTLTVTDDSATEHSYPDFPTVTITLSSNLVGGELYVYTSASWPGASAVAVTDADGNGVSGTIGGTTVTWSHDYDGEGSLAITAIAVNKGTGRYVRATGTIGSGGLTLALSAEDEIALSYTTDSASTSFAGATKKMTPGGAFTAGSYAAVYSDWVRWVEDDVGSKYAQAFRVVGGDEIPDGNLGVTYLVQNSWKIVVDHSIVFTGNLFDADGGEALEAGTGVVLATSQRSAIFETRNVNTGSGLSTAQSTKLTEIHDALALNESTATTVTVLARDDGLVVDARRVTPSSTTRHVTSGDVTTVTRES